MKGEKILVKFGGSVEKDRAAKESICKDISRLHKLGYKIIVVHGGGKEIDSWLGKVGIQPSFYNGLRVTDKATMEVVEMVLAGRVNKEISAMLCSMGSMALGLCGKDCNMVEAKLLKPLSEDGVAVDIGYVGEITGVNEKILELLWSADCIPVIAPVGKDDNGNTVNINADYVAAYIGAKLKVDNLIFLTDVDGVYKNYKKENMQLLDCISAEDIQSLINGGNISDGMIPKVQCCLQAIEQGVEKVSIVNGGKENILYQKVHVNNVVGTTIISEDININAVVYTGEEVKAC